MPVDAKNVEWDAPHPDHVDWGDTGVKADTSKGPNIIEQALHYATGGVFDKSKAALQAAHLQPLDPGVNGDTFSDRYHKNLTNIRNGMQFYAEENPNLNRTAHAAGVVAPLLLPMGGGGIIANAGKGAAIGGAYGFGGTNDESLMGDVGAALGGAALGAATSVAGYGAGSVAGAGAGKFAIRNDMPKADRQAAEKLIATMEKQGVSQADIIDHLTGTNKPVSLMDMGGENSPFSRLGRLLVTMPGKASEDITSFLNTRQEGQRGRVLSDLHELAPNTDTYGTRADLSQERSVNSDPHYQRAFANAGVGPVDYEAARSDLISATSQKAQIAKQIKAIEKNNPGALTARGAAGADVRDQYVGLHDQLQQAEAARIAAASKFENAQAGISAMEGNQPLTDQRLGDFLKDPDIKAGMQRGLAIQKRISLANDEHFDPNAYAITGYDDKGLPQVGPVPTWRTLHAGREGLDSIINDFRDPVTLALPKTKLVDSYVQLRKSYSDHLHNLNPDLTAADAAWAGPSQKMDAMRIGGEFRGLDPEQISQARGRLNQETDPYYQMGAGRDLRNLVNDTRDNREVGAKLVGDQTSRDQLAATFGQDRAQPFIDNANTETAMHNTRQFVKGNSSTANKFAEVFDDGWARHALEGGLAGATPGLAMGNPIVAAGGGLAGAGLSIGRNYAAEGIDKLLSSEGRNLVLAKALTTTGSKGATDLEALLKPAIAGKLTVAKRQALGRAIGSALGRGGTAAAWPLLLSPSTNGTGQ